MKLGLILGAVAVAVAVTLGMFYGGADSEILSKAKAQAEDVLGEPEADAPGADAPATAATGN